MGGVGNAPMSAIADTENRGRKGSCIKQMYRNFRFRSAAVLFHKTRASCNALWLACGFDGASGVESPRIAPDGNLVVLAEHCDVPNLFYGDLASLQRDWGDVTGNAIDFPSRCSGYPKPSSAATLDAEVIHIERKAFTIALKENPRGRFLSITEDIGGRRDTILIPASGLAEFRRVFDEMVKTAGELPGNPPE